MSVNGDDTDKFLSDKVDSLKLNELKEELKKRKMKTSGNKEELVTPLKTALAFEEEHGDKEAEKDETGEEDGEDEENYRSVKYDDDDAEDSSDNDSSHKSTGRTKHLLTFKDVKETMDMFSGDNSINVKQ
ncbi:uncharacterized protein LOC117182576 [Belonocnema kinseyi]|uniref:uncharacterized protein LOC117182576 n=1 Tax=Belonocnema kinseyi TaxID=2817044 RepID=UPI00143D9535|nr:uncharacterized protein LOC117182576 [Belonocnema kinseyi]